MYPPHVSLNDRDISSHPPGGAGAVYNQPCRKLVYSIHPDYPMAHREAYGVYLPSQPQRALAELLLATKARPKKMIDGEG